MPTWLKCEECKEKFYTAKSHNFMEDEGECQYCGSSLHQISPHVDNLLEEEMEIELILSSQKKVYCKIGEVGEEIVDLILEEKNRVQLHSVISADKEIKIRFSIKDSQKGRYYFTTNIVKYYNQEKTLFKVKKPDSIHYFQEKSSPRIPLET